MSKNNPEVIAMPDTVKETESLSAMLESTCITPEQIATEFEIVPREARRWISGEVNPDKKYIYSKMKNFIEKTERSAPYHNNKQGTFRFIDLFAGIGGIRIPFQEQGGECVFTSEWDKFAQVTYYNNFGERPDGDITQITARDIPEHDILLAGFPCQAFSQAGLKQGFMDTRGTMFFEIQRILSHHRPAAFLLENVKQLRGHDKGRTLNSILDILRGENEHRIPDNVPMSQEARESLSDTLNYWVDFRVLRAADFGVPQNRERIFIVGFNKDVYPNADFDSLFRWPEPAGEKTRLGNILFPNSEVEEKYTISDRLWDGHQRRKREHKTK